MFAFSTVKSARLEGLGTSPGGLAAVRFANLFPFPFAIGRNLFAMEMMAYGPSSANAIPSIFTTSFRGNENRWALSAPWLCFPSYERTAAS